MQDLYPEKCKQLNILKNWRWWWNKSLLKRVFFFKCWRKWKLGLTGSVALVGVGKLNILKQIYMNPTLWYHNTFLTGITNWEHKLNLKKSPSRHLTMGAAEPWLMKCQGTGETCIKGLLYPKLCDINVL